MAESDDCQYVQLEIDDDSYTSELKIKGIHDTDDEYDDDLEKSDDTEDNVYGTLSDVTR